MLPRIQYNDIKHLKLEELLTTLNQHSKKRVGDVSVIELFNQDALHKPFAETYYKELYPKGVYLFYDINNQIKYIGQTDSGFFTRLMAHLDTTPGGYFGWNSLLRILGGNRTAKPHHELLEEDHDTDWYEVVNYQLILIDVPHGTITSKQLGWLEKYLQKGYSIIGKKNQNETLLNTRVGGLWEHEWEQSIEQLLATKL